MQYFSLMFSALIWLFAVINMSINKLENEIKQLKNPNTLDGTNPKENEQNDQNKVVIPMY